MVDFKNNLNSIATRIKSTFSFLFLILFVPVFLVCQIIEFNDDVIDGFQLTGLGVISGLIVPYIYFKMRRLLFNHKKSNPLDKLNYPQRKQIREAPYIYIISIFAGLVATTSLNNCFSVAERTEQFRVAGFGTKHSGKSSYQYAVLISGDKKVIYRLSSRDKFEEKQLVAIRLKKGILGYWHP